MLDFSRIYYLVLEHKLRRSTKNSPSASLFLSSTKA
ncbi:hypothetical protein GYH30_050519 [Glycine max]|nr:hypothetical protein GYH30_050519 [Glycine max]